MKKETFILMLIAATLAVKQSNAQAKPPVFRSPMIRPSTAVKPFSITSHPVPPPTLIKIAPNKLSDIDINTGLPQDPNANGGVTYVRSPDPIYLRQSDKSVDPDTEIDRYDTYHVVSITVVEIITVIVIAY